MIYTLDDTIAAIASARGGGRRGIVRLSGPAVQQCVEPLLDSQDTQDATSLARHRRPVVLRARLAIGEPWPPVEADLFYWPTSRSFTGQPSIELHTLGCQPLLDDLLAAVCRYGARLAQPGEFTMRAFLSGRLDLTQAEAVLGVIDATDDRKLDAALGQLAGGLANPLAALRERLIDTLAHLEAGFDFADEDIEFISHDELLHDIDDAAAIVRRISLQMQQRGDAVDRVRIVLVGLPNAGKSSLYNALLQQLRTDPADNASAAIVSELPGTTRDYLVTQLRLGDTACELIDTAGIETILAEPTDIDTPNEKAQTFSREQSRTADIELLCVDSTRPIEQWELDRLDALDPRQIVVLTKCDGAADHSHCGHLDELLRDHATVVRTSSLSGDGLDRLVVRLTEIAAEASGSASDVVVGTAVRCRDSLERASESLDRALTILQSTGDEELVATELRVALDELGQTVGAVHTDDILDRVFSRFCVGK